jgi:hypothetical protein
MRSHAKQRICSGCEESHGPLPSSDRCDPPVQDAMGSFGVRQRSVLEKSRLGGRIRFRVKSCLSPGLQAVSRLAVQLYLHRSAGIQGRVSTWPEQSVPKPDARWCSRKILSLIGQGQGFTSRKNKVSGFGALNQTPSD